MKQLIRIAMVTIGLCALSVQADVSLTLELDGPDMESRTKKLSLARFFVRIDDPAEPDSFLLYQTGRFFPLYRVDKSNETYTQLTPEARPTIGAGSKAQARYPKHAATDKDEKPAGGSTGSQAASSETEAVKATESTATEVDSKQDKVRSKQDVAEKPANDSPKTKLRLTKKKKTIAGIRCRVVEEFSGGQPVMTHCMADKARLGITEREIRSLARLFKMARERDFGWLGTHTKDEDFVSIASEDLQSKKTMRLTAVDTKFLPAGYLRIPRHYKKTSLK